MTIRYLTGGESHGPALMGILEGIPAGLKLSEDVINHQLSRRQKGYGSGPRMKLESDRVQILSGVMGGETIGSPISLQIENKNHEKWKDKDIEAFMVPRPGHVDLAAAIKYGYKDLRPGLERSSARETAARVAIGAICAHLLSYFGIQIGGYVLSIGGVDSDLSQMDYKQRFVAAECSDLRCPDAQAAEAMREKIDEIIKEKDTLGGVIEIIALGVPAGLGSHVQWDRRLDARLSASVMSVQAIKGVEIGCAFDNSKLKGTQAHDGIRIDSNDIIRESNRAGGLEGGITNGEPIVIRAAMKPIASTIHPQRSVNLVNRIETETQYERSDYCPVPRAVPVLESAVAFILADALLEKTGGDSIPEIDSRVEKLRKTNLDDIDVDGIARMYW